MATQGRGDAGWWITTYTAAPLPSLLFATYTIFILYPSNLYKRLYYSVRRRDHIVGGDAALRSRGGQAGKRGPRLVDLVLQGVKDPKPWRILHPEP